MSRHNQTECANPLLLQWLKEWLDVARDQNHKGATVYKHAYDSMKACPLVFDHPQEAEILKGLGPKLCGRLTDKLKEYCDENGLPMPKSKKGKKRPIGDGDPDAPNASESPAPKKSRKSKPKPYVPDFGSGPYAIIKALSTLGESSSGGLKKIEIIELAQPDCNSSFTAPSHAGGFYTAWDSMKTLQKKGLVYEWGGPTKKYVLSDEGWEIAKGIKGSTGSDPGGDSGNDPKTKPHSTDKANPQAKQRTSEKPVVQKPAEDRVFEVSPLKPRSANLQSQDSVETDFIRLLSSSPPLSQPLEHHHPTCSAKPATAMKPTVPVMTCATELDEANEDKIPSFQPLRISPRTFTVELVLDNREVRSKTDRDYFQNELSMRGVEATVRSLELGDACWIAKCKDPLLLSRLGEDGDEIILDWIAERKRLDDLIGSVKDGRFHEQKFRLQRSGVKNVVFIIEDFTIGTDQRDRNLDMVNSAIASTQVLNGYFVKQTQKPDDTIRYLARMTSMLRKLYEPRTLHLIPSHLLSPRNYLPTLASLRIAQPSTPHYITYPCFASLASKSEVLSLRDVFLKMLMCTRGITGAKALEMQKHWTTPSALVEAFEACAQGPGARGIDTVLGRDRGGLHAGKGSDAWSVGPEDVARRRRELVWSVMGGMEGRRKIGKAVSAKVAEVWGEEGGVRAEVGSDGERGREEGEGEEGWAL